jgi:hypothetical protein
MWKHSQRVTTAVTTLSIINVLTFIITMLCTLVTATFGPATFPITGCTLVPSFGLQYITFITCVVFETAVIVLTAIRLSTMIHGHQMRMPLISLLMQDGLIYYIVIASMHFLLLFSAILPGFSLASSFFQSSLAIAVAGVACNRMLLRLQSVLLFNEVHASGIGMTGMDVSVRIGPDTILGTTDIEAWNSTATSSRI